MELVKSVIEKIQTKQAVIGVVGLGYVGLPLLETFRSAGFQVWGIDINPNVVDHFAGAFPVSNDFDTLKMCDAIFICVPTPLGPNKQPNLYAVTSAADMIGERLRPGQLIVLESTTYPGTTREVLLPIIDRGRCTLDEDDEDRMMCGEDYFLAFSPERVDPGRDIALKDVPKVVGGLEQNSYEVAKTLYAAAFTEVIGVSNAETAEATKLLENIYRAVNIALVNELKCIFNDMSIPEIPINIWEVIQAAATKPYGFQPFYPGPGVGGHCIPLDPFYLSWKAKEIGWPTRFIELAGEINESMPDYVVQKTMLALNERGVAVKRAKILVMGIAYKPNVGDWRESPGLRIFHKFRKLGAAVFYDDPHVAMLPGTTDRCYNDGDDHPDFGDFDAVVMVTAHDEFTDPDQMDAIRHNAKLIIDTRHVVPDGPNVVRA